MSEFHKKSLCIIYDAVNKPTNSGMQNLKTTEIRIEPSPKLPSACDVLTVLLVLCKHVRHILDILFVFIMHYYFGSINLLQIRIQYK